MTRYERYSHTLHSKLFGLCASAVFTKAILTDG